MPTGKSKWQGSERAVQGGTAERREGKCREVARERQVSAGVAHDSERTDTGVHKTGGRRGCPETKSPERIWLGPYNTICILRML